MKLFLKRDTSADNISFMIYDNMGLPKYSVSAEIGNWMKMVVFSGEGEQRSVIRYNKLMLDYFTILCQKRFYVLIPNIKNGFAFTIYGSTYKFNGKPGDDFYMSAPDGTVVMTHKRCRSSGMSGFEITINDEAHEMFLLSAAICADMYLDVSEKQKAVPLPT